MWPLRYILTMRVHKHCIQKTLTVGASKGFTVLNADGLIANTALDGAVCKLSDYDFTNNAWINLRIWYGMSVP